MKKIAKNQKGVIAKTYSELQSIPILQKAKLGYQAGKANDVSTMQAILQATEIGIQNITELIIRICSDIENENYAKASIKFGWLKDINDLIVKITNLPNLLFFTPLNNGVQLQTNKKLSSNLKKLDVILKTGFNSLHEILNQQNLNDNPYRILHDYRIFARAIVIWNRNLSILYIPHDTNYAEFTGLKYITKAVSGIALDGDTFFKQFRCLHQIPEILTAELNDYIENAVVDLRVNNLESAYGNLKQANTIFEITLQALNPIVNNLSHNDYHEIRENLGLTSGSHSVNLHFHLFRDLYATLAGEYVAKFFVDELSYYENLENNFNLKIVEKEILKLRNSIDQWRNQHLNLPRVNLGENQTKSLIGAKDAVDSAKKMQIAANSRDPLKKIAGLYIKNGYLTNSVIDYIDSNKSFDTLLGNILGSITNERFTDVQNREGVFAHHALFKNPPKREV